MIAARHLLSFSGCATQPGSALARHSVTWSTQAQPVLQSAFSGTAQCDPAKKEEMLPYPSKRGTSRYCACPQRLIAPSAFLLEISA